jgi:phosphoribosylformylglycinamidine synthase
MLAVAEASRNVACAGGAPIGATNCLNFGNPERPEIMWQLVEAIEGIAEACRALDVPITGGNVSLYNETDGKAIYPTPILGVVGLLDDASRVLGRAFRGEGEDVVLLGEGFGELGGSEYLKVVHGLVKGQPPRLDLERERALIGLLGRAASTGLLRSAHDCADGGLAVTLAECAFDTDGLGVEADLPADGDVPATLFGESASRVVVSVERRSRDALLALAQESGVPARVIGRTGGSRLHITIDGAPAIDCAVADAEQVWSSALATYYARRVA